MGAVHLQPKTWPERSVNRKLVCRRKGHNRKSCIVQRDCDINSQMNSIGSKGYEEEELNDDWYDANIDMVSVRYILVELRIYLSL